MTRPTRPTDPDDERETTTERILCAAVWYPDGPTLTHAPQHPLGSGLVLCGHDHAAIIQQAAFFKGWRSPQDNQGFITNTNRFVGRQEAWRIAEAAAQVGGHMNAEPRDLYSEDLNYPDA